MQSKLKLITTQQHIVINSNYWLTSKIYPIASFTRNSRLNVKYHIIADVFSYRIIKEVINKNKSVCQYEDKIYPELMEILKQLPNDPSSAKPIKLINNINELCEI